MRVPRTSSQLASRASSVKLGASSESASAAAASAYTIFDPSGPAQYSPTLISSDKVSQTMPFNLEYSTAHSLYKSCVIKGCVNPRDAEKIASTYEELRNIASVTFTRLSLLGKHSTLSRLSFSLVNSLRVLYDEGKTTINMIANIVLQLRSAQAPPIFSDVLIRVVLPAEIRTVRAVSIWRRRIEMSSMLSIYGFFIPPLTAERREKYRGWGSTDSASEENIEQHERALMHRVRLRFRHNPRISEDGIKRLFAKSPSGKHLPRHIMWKLFRAMRTPKSIFEKIFEEIKMVDHDTSDDNNDMVEMEDFILWMNSDKDRSAHEEEAVNQKSALLSVSQGQQGEERKNGEMKVEDSKNEGGKIKGGEANDETRADIDSPRPLFPTIGACAPRLIAFGTMMNAVAKCWSRCSSKVPVVPLSGNIFEKGFPTADAPIPPQGAPLSTVSFVHTSSVSIDADFIKKSEYHACIEGLRSALVTTNDSIGKVANLHHFHPSGRDWVCEHLRKVSIRIKRQIDALQGEHKIYTSTFEKMHTEEAQSAMQEELGGILDSVQEDLMELALSVQVEDEEFFMARKTRYPGAVVPQNSEHKDGRWADVGAEHEEGKERGGITWSNQAMQAASRLSTRIWLKLLDEQRIARDNAVATKLQTFWRRRKLNLARLSRAALRDASVSASSPKAKLEAKTDIQSQELRRLEEDLTCTFGPEVVARQLMEDLVSFMESSADLDDIENTVEHTKQDIREALEIVQPSGGVERLVNLSPEDSEILCEILSGIEISLIEHTTKLKLHRQRQSTLKPHWSSYAPLQLVRQNAARSAKLMRELSVETEKAWSITPGRTPGKVKRSQTPKALRWLRKNVKKIDEKLTPLKEKMRTKKRAQKMKKKEKKKKKTEMEEKQTKKSKLLPASSLLAFQHGLKRSRRRSLSVGLDVFKSPRKTEHNTLNWRKNLRGRDNLRLLKKVFARAPARKVRTEVLETLFELEHIEPIVRAKIFKEIQKFSVREEDGNDVERMRSNSFISEEDMLGYIHSDMDFGVVTPRIDEVDDRLKYRGDSFLMKRKKSFQKKKEEEEKQQQRHEKNKPKLRDHASPETPDSEDRAETAIRIGHQPTRVQRALNDIVASVLIALDSPGATLFAVFDTFNIDGSRDGISRGEFMKFISELGIGTDLSSEEQAGLFDRFDRDRDGTIEFLDFASTMRTYWSNTDITPRRGHTHLSTEAALR